MRDPKTKTAEQAARDEIAMTAGIAKLADVAPHLAHLMTNARPPQITLFARELENLIEKHTLLGAAKDDMRLILRFASEDKE